MTFAKLKNSNASQLFESLLGEEAQNRRSFYGLKWVICEDVLVMISVLWSKFSSIETIEGPQIPCSFF